jgi:putative salt-induced outer membrane protein YdiY
MRLDDYEFIHVIKKLYKIKIAIVGFLLTITFCGSTFADEVLIKNGDRISGQIIGMKNHTLTIETPYAGQIIIQWDQVTSIETDSIVHVVLEDKTAGRGILKKTETEELTLETENLMEPLRFSISQVEFINPPSEPSVKFKGRVNAGIDVHKGNTDTDAYYLDGELVARTQKNRYTVGGEVNREEESGEETADNWFLYTSYDHFLTQKWYLYTKANFEQDDFKDLNLRTIIGAGSGYQFFEEGLRNLSVQGGIAYVNEDYSISGEDNNYSAGIWNVDYDQYFFNKFIQFFHHHEGTIGLEDTEDLLVRTRTGLRIPLGNSFNTTFQYNWDWHNTPAPGTDRVDERYLFTIGYRWN